MDNLKLAPPWFTFANEMKAMFETDEEVRVVFNQQSMEIKLYVENAAKAEALEKLLVKEAVFGGVTVRVTVVPGNKPGDKLVNVYATAFADNEALVDTKYVSSPLGDFIYIIWTSVPAQFFDDNLADYLGNATMLMEDVARDVMAELPGVCHCTEDMGTLGGKKQWP